MQASKINRWLECVLLFFLLPCLLYIARHQLAFRVFFLLIAAAVTCSIVLIKDASFDRRVFKRFHPMERNIRSVLGIFLPGAALFAIVTIVFLPDKLLVFPKAKPSIWMVVLALYPLLFVLPQELVFRTFFFHRYQMLFAGSKPMILFNALSFSLAHLFYGNWVAPVLSFAGGILFAWRYHTSRSLPVVALEHALWGNYMFTIGIGWYFYSGAIT